MLLSIGILWSTSFLFLRADFIVTKTSANAAQRVPVALRVYSNPLAMYHLCCAVKLIETSLQLEQPEPEPASAFRVSASALLAQSNHYPRDG